MMVTITCYTSFSVEENLEFEEIFMNTVVGHSNSEKVVSSHEDSFRICLVILRCIHL